MNAAGMIPTVGMGGTPRKNAKSNINHIGMIRQYTKRIDRSSLCG